MFFTKVQARFWFGLTGNLAFAAITAAAAEHFISFSLPAHWPTFILSILAGGAIYCTVLLLLNFVTEDDKQVVRKILKG